MAIRIVTSVIALLLFIPLIWFGSWPLEVAMALLAVLAVVEFIQMKKSKLKSFPSIAALIGVALMVLSFSILPLDLMRVLMAVTVLLLFYTVTNITYTTPDAGSTLLMLGYSGIGFYSFVALREYSPSFLILILLVIWSTDTGAYMIGKRMGKTKLAPSISPNKTIEGSVGGTLLSAIISAVYLFYFQLFDSYILSLLFMVGLSVIGQTGDLIESKIKREYGTKDTGHLLPGHGGILDRFDSMLLVLNVLFIMDII